jgi:hypothetical protein
MPTTNTLPTGRAHSVPTHPASRRHRREVARWALANGHPMDRDALAAIVAARTARATGAVDLRWVDDDVERVLWYSLPEWCVEHQVRPLADPATTLATYLRFLSAHRMLAPGSAGITALRRTVADHRPSVPRSRGRHPAAARSAPVLPIS